MPSSDSSRDVLLERLAAEFVERHRNGEHPPLSEYTDRYPDLAADIRDLFPALVRIEKLKPAAEATGAFEQNPAVTDGFRMERLGDYRIVREVGRGGMGVVYEAEQESLGRHVALKVLPSSALLHPTYLERFRREAKATTGNWRRSQFFLWVDGRPGCGTWLPSANTGRSFMTRRPVGHPLNGMAACTPMAAGWPWRCPTDPVSGICPVASNWPTCPSVMLPACASNLRATW